VTIINLSLSKGVFPDSLKVAKLTPILKKANADHEVFSNFRPVSDLQFLCKQIQKRLLHISLIVILLNLVFMICFISVKSYAQH